MVYPSLLTYVICSGKGDCLVPSSICFLKIITLSWSLMSDTGDFHNC